MTKIKLEDNSIFIYIKESKSSFYDINKFFKIDLFGKKYYSIKDDKLELLEWIFSDEEYDNLVNNSLTETKKMIINHLNVIYSHKQRNEYKQIEKVERQLKMSKEILNSLEDFIENVYR